MNERVSWFTRCPIPSSLEFRPAPFCVILSFRRRGSVVVGRHVVERQVSDEVMATELIRESARI